MGESNGNAGHEEHSNRDEGGLRVNSRETFSKENKSIKISKTEAEKNNGKKRREVWNNVKPSNIHEIGNHRKKMETKGVQEIFEDSIILIV